MSDYFCVAIDPGVSGALAAIWSGGAEAFDTPTIAIRTGGKTKSGNPKKKREYNEQLILRLLQTWKVQAAALSLPLSAVIEDVHAMPKDSKPGCFTFGESKGIWRGMLAALQIPYQLVRPETWRPAMVGRGTDKAASLVAAQRLFPTIDLSKKNDHNRAEALLMAQYLRQKLAGRRPGTENDDQAGTVRPSRAGRHKAVRVSLLLPELDESV